MAQQRFAEARRLRGEGRLDKAVTVCQGLLRDHPDFVGALHLLGLLHMDRRDPWSALSCFHRATLHNPEDHTLLANLAGAYHVLGATEMAERTLQTALDLAPDEPAIHFTLGQLLAQGGAPERAQTHLERVLAHQSGHALAAYERAECHSAMGRPDKAAPLYETALGDPAIAGLALLALADLPDALVTVDRAALAARLPEPDPKADPDAAARRHFIHAILRHREGDAAQAWQELEAANALVAAHDGTDTRSARATLERQLDAARRYSARPAPDDQKLPVSLFLMGPSRSGKTTLETLLGAVPGVHRGFESKIVQRATRMTRQAAGLLTGTRLADLPHTLDDRFRTLYLRLVDRACGEGRVYVNTNPHLVADAGRIATTVPNARFVFMRRDRLDNAFRIFARQYKPASNLYACRLDTIAEHLDWYAAMSDAWAASFPDRTLKLSYEGLVDDPGAALAAVCALCGLDAPAPPSGVPDDRGCARPYLDRLRPAIGDPPTS